MTTDAWKRAEEIFDRVVAAPAEQRAALLNEACAGDDALRAEVESLLEHDASANGGFLAAPALAFHKPGEPSPAWAERLIGRKLGHFTILRPIGFGGMGCVFEAQQDRPARAVALKVLAPGSSAPSALARFRLEPEVLGRLQHPNIAKVFEAGVHDDPDAPGRPLPYFALELIPGARSLVHYADEHELTVRRRLELFAKVCDAIHHGHQKGIVHRDLKPANILVGQDGEPKVIDFGVARASDVDVVMTTQCTHVGDLVGTVHYMSPEQCDGDPAAIDTRSDVYSLGVVLYELLTGTAPYDTSGATVYSAIRTIKDEPPRRPSAINRRFRGDIEAILLRALEKDPARRYASAAALAQDVRKHLAGEPTEARPPRALTRAARWILRHPIVTTTLVCLAVLMVGAGAGFSVYYIAMLQPHHTTLAEDLSTARLETATGMVLREWGEPGERRVVFAELVSPPPELGGGQYAIIGHHAWTPDPPYGGFAFYDTSALEKPARTLHLNDDDIPESRKQRELTSLRSYRSRNFGAQLGLLADVFDDPPGVEADELIAVFMHEAVTTTAICVYRLDGKLLYRVWIDAHICSVEWLAESKLLLCAGANGEATWEQRGITDVPSGIVMHPNIVFSIRPEDGFVTKDFVVQEVNERAGTDPRLLPVWYYAVRPARNYCWLDSLTSIAVERPEAGATMKESVLFSVPIRADLDYSGESGAPRRGWIIAGDGTVNDEPIPSFWEAYGATDECPDRPLPRRDALYLGPLPPIVKPGIPASQPSSD